MGKKQFDKNIKEKLEELHINYDAASWDSFEKKLDSAMSEQEFEDLEFDQQIKDKIQDRLSFDFEEEHWQELSTRIDHDNELANKIYLFKIIELVILVLLAYSFFQIEPIKNPAKNLPLYAHSEIFKSIDQKKVLEKLVGNNSVVQDNLASENSLSSIILDRKANEVLLLNYDKVTAIAPIVFDHVDIAPLINTVSDRGTSVSSTNENVEIAHDFANLSLAEKSAQRDLLAINELKSESNNIIIPPPFIHNKTEKWLSLTSSADINLVNTPTEFIINSGDQILEAAGLSGAISYGVKSGKNEFEMGLGYSYKNYDPDLRKFYNVDSNGSTDNSLYRTSLNRIAFHIAQVPISYKRYLVDNRNWSVFMAVGFTPNFILYSDYNLTDELLSGIIKPWNNRKANSDLLKRTYYTGLLQNIQPNDPVKKRSSSTTDEFRTEGNIFDNAFITSMTGLGVQRNLGLNHSIFLQTSYHHQFFGDKLGPNNDQINTFSFTLGSKFRI